MKLNNKIIFNIAKFTCKYPFKGMERILRFIYSPDKLANNYIETTINNYDKDLKMRINTSSFIEWVIFFKKYYEPAVTKIIKSRIKPGDTVIDIGANVGVHTLVMAKSVKSRGKVYAFEPNPEIAKRLKNNISLNGYTQVRVLEKGLSNKQTKADFFVYSDREVNKGISSLYRDHLGSEYSKIKIEINTLDNFVKKQ